jgi:hypothetical protein
MTASAATPGESTSGGRRERTAHGARARGTSGEGGGIPGGELLESRVEEKGGNVSKKDLIITVLLTAFAVVVTVMFLRNGAT